MKYYIKPSTEIIPTDMQIMSGVSTHDGPGDGNEFSNTTTFEQEITTDMHNLWEE